MRRERSAVRAARRERRLGSNSAWLLYSRSCALSELALHLSAPFSPRRGDQQRTHTRTRLPRSSWACSLRPSERPSATTNTAASHLAVAARAAARAAHTPSATPWRPHGADRRMRGHPRASTAAAKRRRSTARFAPSPVPRRRPCRAAASTTAAQCSSLCSSASAARETLPRRRELRVLVRTQRSAPRRRASRPPCQPRPRAAAPCPAARPRRRALGGALSRPR